MFDLTKKDTTWSWVKPEECAFIRPRDMIMAELVLALPDHLCMFWLKADSSDYATGMILSQQSAPDEKWHLVTFYSKSLDNVQCNYKIHDKEMLVIIHALEGWRHFLEGTVHLVEIWTDQKNLEYFRKLQHLNC